VCGLAGVVLKEPGPLGEALVRQGQAIRHRGNDSTGFALYGPPGLAPGLDVHARGAASQAVVRWLEAGGNGDVESFAATHARQDELFLRVDLVTGAALDDAVAEIEARGGWVHGGGTCVRVVKDLGDAITVDAGHAVSELEGTHGIVHCRLATESIVDVDYSHPFWARPFPDVTVVHHGHITNYDRLRRIMVGRGYRFATGNDSELAAVWLAERISTGLSFEEALEEAASTFDGTFLLLFGTPEGIGAARDKYGACPLVIAEDERAIAFGSEMRAVLALVDPASSVVHMPEEEVITWSVASTAVR
jgi:hypothetical protein